MLCHPQTFWPLSRSNHSPRYPKISFSGSNTRVLGASCVTTLILGSRFN